MVSQICTLWPLRFHQEFFIFSLMQPECPDIPRSWGPEAERCALLVQRC